jgi:hypothetical protein
VSTERICDRMSQRIEGRLRPRSERRLKVTPLARRCWANTRMCDWPGQTENVCTPALFEPECGTAEQMKMRMRFADTGRWRREREEGQFR